MKKIENFQDIGITHFDIPTAEISIDPFISNTVSGFIHRIGHTWLDETEVKGYVDWIYEVNNQGEVKDSDILIGVNISSSFLNTDDIRKVGIAKLMYVEWDEEMWLTVTTIGNAMAVIPYKMLEDKDDGDHVIVSIPMYGELWPFGTDIESIFQIPGKNRVTPVIDDMIVLNFNCQVCQKPHTENFSNSSFKTTLEEALYIAKNGGTTHVQPINGISGNKFDKWNNRRN